MEKPLIDVLCDAQVALANVSLWIDGHAAAPHINDIERDVNEAISELKDAIHEVSKEPESHDV